MCELDADGLDLSDNSKLIDLRLELLDNEKFDIYNYINTVFCNDQSLTKIDSVINEIDEKIKDLDIQTKNVIRNQLQAEEDGQEVIKNAADMIDNLFKKVRQVQEQATKSEETVREITSDIQRLDRAKRNLTLSITTLNNLLFIVETLDRLREIINPPETPLSTERNPFGSPRTQNYPEIESKLGTAQRLLDPIISSFPDVSSVQNLRYELESIQTSLSNSIESEMKLAINTVDPHNKQATSQIISGCKLMMILPNQKIAQNFQTWFINNQLSEYVEIYDPSQTLSWFDNLDHRFQWLQGNYRLFQAKCSVFFPIDWFMMEKILIDFCRLTKDHFEKLIKTRIAEIDQNMFINALQKTLAFESSLGQICPNDVIDKLSAKYPNYRLFNQANAKEKPQKKPNPAKTPFDEVKNLNPFDEESPPTLSYFENFISCVFVNHFEIYLNYVEKSLSEPLHSKFIGDYTSTSKENILNSATDFFLICKKLLKNTLALNTGRGLLGLANLFNRYMKIYVEKILLADVPGLNLVLASMSSENGANSTHDDNRIVSSALTTTGNISTHIFMNIVKDDHNLGELSKEHRYKVSICIVTASYCSKSMSEFEKRLRDEVKPKELADKVSFIESLEALSSCRNTLVNRLVLDLDSQIEQYLIMMNKINWSTITQVGDQSRYISGIQKGLSEYIPELRDNLHSVKAHFTQFCIKFSSYFIQRFESILLKCKPPISTFGAEQLLLDTQSLKTILMKIPTMGTKVMQAPPKSYSMIVQEGMGKVERIIKSIMLPIGNHHTNTITTSNGNPDESTRFKSTTGFVTGPIDEEAAKRFLSSYLEMIPDSTLSQLQKILDIKGVKKSEQSVVLDCFQKKVDRPPHQKPNENESKQEDHSKSSPDTMKRTNLLSNPFGSSSNTSSILDLKPFREIISKRKS